MNFSESLALKAVSILLALILWITILGFKREDVVVQVKLEPLLPPGMMITNKIPSHIQYTLAGPRVWLKEAEKGITPIRPDLRHTRDSDIEFSVSENLLGELPPSVRVKDFYPQQVSIQLEEIVERYVSVKPTFQGRPEDGWEIAQIKVSPTKVAVSGPKKLLDQEEFIGTEPFDIENAKGAVEGEVLVEADDSKGYQLSRQKVVKLRVLLKRVIKED